MYCNGLNSVRVTQTGLLRTCHRLSQTSRHVEMVCVHDFRDLCSRLLPKLHDLLLFVSATFMICVRDFPHGEVSVKVGIMEFGLKTTSLSAAVVWNFSRLT